MSGSFVRSFIQHRVFAPVFTKHVSTALCTEIKGPGARPRLCPQAPGRRAGRLERGLALDGAFSSGRGTWSDTRWHRTRPLSHRAQIGT